MRKYPQRLIDGLFILVLMFNISAYSLSAYAINRQADQSDISIREAAKLLEANPIAANVYYVDNTRMIFGALVSPALLTGLYFMFRNWLPERFYPAMIFFVFMLVALTAKDSISDLAVVLAKWGP